MINNVHSMEPAEPLDPWEHMGYSQIPDLHDVEPKEITLHIVGSNGKIGKDLEESATTAGIVVEPDPANADFVAVCTPSHVAEPILEDDSYKGKIMLDLSGAAKQHGIGQYGLMHEDGAPWDRSFNTSSDLYTNPGCIAGAVIAGLGKAGLSGESLPESLGVFSVGGQTHAPVTETDELKLARRLNDHPHVDEIERAFGYDMRVHSFMPSIGDIPSGLLVAAQGKTRYHPKLNPGSKRLTVSDVVGTSLLKHRLEFSPPDASEGEAVDFSLAVVIDNLRFVTQNAVLLMQYVARHR